MSSIFITKIGGLIREIENGKTDKAIIMITDKAIIMITEKEIIITDSKISLTGHREII